MTAGPTPAPMLAPAGVPTEARVARRESLAQLARSKTFLIGIVVVGWWVFWAIAGSRLTPHDPLGQEFDILKRPQGDNWLGTDQLGRDVLSRVLAGASDTLQVAPLAALLGVGGGTVIGLVGGYFRGLVDETITILTNSLLALPVIVVAVVAIAALGTSRSAVIIVIGVVFMPLVARTVRAAVLAERELAYVSAARLRGEPAVYIMFVEILPNVLGPIIVETTVRLGYAIFAIAGLTFLGFGVQPPSPDWSLQIADNYQLLNTGTDWWTVLFPALAIMTLIVGVNLIADGLQQVFDR
jgi:peptide/nickel transport system permease protein